MNKEEILAKSRESMKKEEEAHVDNSAKVFGFKMLTIFIAVLVVFNLFTGRTSYDLISLTFASVSAQYYFRYKAYEKKNDKISYIASLIASICFLINHIIVSL